MPFDKQYCKKFQWQLVPVISILAGGCMITGLAPICLQKHTYTRIHRALDIEAFCHFRGEKETFAYMNDAL